MADSRRKSTAEGKRPMAESGATEEEEETGERCDVCDGPLKPPVYQSSSQRRVIACSDCGARQRRSPADLAVDVVSRHLGYFRVPCPYAQYGCASSVASRDAAAHAAACAHAPCACPGCAFLGSPAQLVQHLTAGPHDFTVTKFTYGKDVPFVVNMEKEEPREEKHLLVAEEDGGVFLLALALGGHGQEPHSGRAAVVCVRGNEDAGPAYRSSVVAECLPHGRGAISVSETFKRESPWARKRLKLPSCSLLGPRRVRRECTVCLCVSVLAAGGGDQGAPSAHPHGSHHLDLEH